MELWVRSQDRESIIKVEKLELIYDCLCSDEVQLFHIDSDKQRLASYSTKERALEVLDEIHEHIEKYGETYLKENGVKHYGSVYQMPSE